MDALRYLNNKIKEEKRKNPINYTYITELQNKIYRIEKHFSHNWKNFIELENKINAKTS